MLNPLQKFEKAWDKNFPLRSINNAFNLKPILVSIGLFVTTLALGLRPKQGLAKV
jgi:hypothetical protein